MSVVFSIERGFMLISMTRFVVRPIAVVLMVLGVRAVYGQNYPNKPVHLVLPEAGGNSDLVGRLIAQGISGDLGQPVVGDNRPGNLIGEVVARAAPDGYTLGLGAGVIWLSTLLQKTSYDAVKDFSGVTMVSATPLVLVVHPSVPAKSVKELVALAKASPGQLNYSSSAAGSESNLAVALLKSMAGVNIVRVPFRGAPQALTAVIVGEVQLMSSPVPSAMPNVKSGRLRALAVTSLTPSTLAPGLPTVAASGLPGYETVVLIGILAPKATPAGVINLLNQEILRFLTRADVKEKFVSLGTEVVTSSPEQFSDKIKSELVKWAKVIKDAGIKAE